MKKCVCVLHNNENNISGTIILTQQSQSSKVKINYDIKNLNDGHHGFHIHEYGDLTQGCTSACSHFNPFNNTHGGRGSKNRHVGDLGNITSKSGIAKGVMYDSIISLSLSHDCCVVGRCIVIHENRDDLGKGKNKESLITGNAGARLACGVIGISQS